MSSIYITEPPTEGKVLLTTTAGEIEIELWSKEAPLACRNFVQLCLEGYFNNTIFHRVIPGFIVQGGDPTGTGNGGESIYERPFKDEFHSRLHFTRRGLLAMANSRPNDNGSQFFITLGPCKELNNKHTIFAKVTGDTLYNLPRFEEGEIGKDDRPIYPYKISKTEVLVNPFTDIVTREKIKNELSKKERKHGKKKGVKNFSLLSFGGEAEQEEEDIINATREMGGSGGAEPSLMDVPTEQEDAGIVLPERDGAKDRIRAKLTKISTDNGEDKTEENTSASLNQFDTKVQKRDELKRKMNSEDEQDPKSERNKLTIIDDKNPSDCEAKEVTERFQETNEEKTQKMSEMKSEIKKLKRELMGRKTSTVPKVEDINTTVANSNSAVQEYNDIKQKYVSQSNSLGRKGDGRENLTHSLLEKFNNRLKKALSAFEYNDSEKDDPKELADESDDWMQHKLIFDDSSPVLAKDANTKDDSWYSLEDPRHPSNKRRREESKQKVQK